MSTDIHFCLASFPVKVWPAAYVIYSRRFPSGGRQSWLV